eukprot:scaffold25405_cov53-Phaeocystis_antarctica.AAC.1
MAMTASPPPPSPSPPPALQKLQVGGVDGIALDDVMDALRSDDLAGLMVQLRLSAGTHTLTNPMSFDESVVASEVTLVGDAGSIIRLPAAAVVGRQLEASDVTGTIRAAFSLNSTLKLHLEGMTIQGDATSYGVAAVVVHRGLLVMQQCAVPHYLTTSLPHSALPHRLTTSPPHHLNNPLILTLILAGALCEAFGAPVRYRPSETEARWRSEAAASRTTWAARSWLRRAAKSTFRIVSSSVTRLRRAGPSPSQAPRPRYIWLAHALHSTWLPAAAAACMWPGAS